MSCVTLREMARLLPLTSLALLACGSPDASDQRQVLRLCGLPAASRALAWSGFPARSGFGQREGLRVSGTFLPPAGWTPTGAGWRPAPWPRARDVAERAFGLGAVLDGASALRCETAGNNVLYARSTRPCDAVDQPLDIVLCARLPSGEVRAAVRSGY